MATRNKARRLQDLIKDALHLEAIASLVQGDDEAAGLAASEELATGYRRWFASSMELLSEDLRDRFRREYDGGIMSPKAKKFLENPRMRSVLYRDDLPDSSKELFPYWQYPVKMSFLDSLNQQVHYLEEEIARCGMSSETAAALELLDQISRRLPIAFSILSQGNANNAKITVPKISINNEYDVQHILHSIAVLHFEEVEPEEPTPKMAGGSSRLDFLLKRERVAIETKMMGTNLSLKTLRGDLAKDIVYFKAHPYITSLFILVYDPQRKITNAIGFENDFRSDSDDFIVRAVVVG